MAKSLGANILSNSTTNMSTIASIASGIPLACFDTVASSNPSSIINSISSMDLVNMDAFRKNYIALKVFIVF